MSSYCRKELFREQLVLKGLHLANISKSLVNILPVGFSFQEYLDAFKVYYPYTWEDICSYCRIRKNNYRRRTQKHLRTIPFLTPQEFLKLHAKIKRTNNQTLSGKELSDFKFKLTTKAANTMKERSRKLADNLVYVQEVCPSYVKLLIKAYFDIRKRDTLNINARYLILMEAAQFKCRETIEFLEKVNACDKNHDLRLIAFKSLQRMGKHPWLARGRKGKRKESMIKPIDIKTNPTELLNLLYDNQEMLYQKFDIFLSHSSFDTKELLRLKCHLNSLGKVVYIDWMNDRIMLNRKYQNDDTWPALELRMNQSDVLLYVLTDNAIRSPYTEREVKYFKKQNKKVYIYQPNSISMEVPIYLKDCEYCQLNNNKPIL